MRLKIDILGISMAFVMGAYIGYYFGDNHLREDFRLNEENLRDQIDELHYELNMVRGGYDIYAADAFNAFSDSIHTTTNVIKRQEVKKIKTYVDSLEFIAKKKIELHRLKKYNDSVEEYLLRTEIDNLKKEVK
jgi:hypothetical protein